MSKNETVKPGPGKPAPSAASGSRLAAAMSFKGDVTGGGPLTIEGRFKGSIRCPDSDLTVGPDAQVEADIIAANIEVAGAVTGDIEASGRILIAAQARMAGDLSAARVAVQDGAQFKGTIKINRPAS
jgi:cytoskeletal protein CcmA (bactofilin family)